MNCQSIGYDLILALCGAIKYQICVARLLMGICGTIVICFFGDDLILVTCGMDVIGYLLHDC